jgi:ABC-2 type transport system ATP-binding protein
VNVIEVENLSKDYRQHFWTPIRRVLDSVSFEVKRGEIFGFLGPNGSGKSTTIKLLFQIIFPTAGTARLFGKEFGDKDAKRRTGFLPENPYFYDYLTATQFLKFHGQLLGLTQETLAKRIPEVLELVGMRGTEEMYLRSFSKGMLQRIGLAQAILHEPELVVLDEPMTGLDPLGRKEIRDLMLHLREKGTTVFFSTHILSDVETVCDRVAILNKGKLLKCGSLAELLSLETKYVDILWRVNSSKLLEFLRGFDTRLSSSGDIAYMKFSPFPKEPIVDFERRINQLIQKGIEMGGTVQSVSPKKDSLEDFFVKQIGRLETRV